ncbi:MAG: phosphoribosyltransferase [Microscillaceae bacterium]|jgi:pyrimidine operon attenuation protein/uracil phosphoribosyltransferase|nr:phosphoribosyltransferase [Microscillaceae bacterium]
MTKKKLLDKTQISQKIRRMAFQIYENNFEESAIVFAGIAGTGYTLAQMIQAEFGQISPIPSVLCKVSLDKFHPVQSEVTIDVDIHSLADKTIVLVDDVLNTGRTFAYSLKPFLKIRIHKLQTAVLVDRGHKNFPISADYVGYALSTTLQEMITVVLADESTLGVYLS